MDLSWLSSLLLTTLVVIGILRVVAWIRRTFLYWRNKGVPYFPDSLSSQLLTLRMCIRGISFVDYFQFAYNYFPSAKYVGFIDFATPTLLLRDPELIKEVMVKDFESFSDHHGFADESVDRLLGKNISSLRGDHWKEMRNTLSPSFTASKMKFMFDLVSECSHNFVNYLVDHPKICRAVETKEAFRRYTTDVIATAAFGINVNSMKNPDNEFYIRGVEASKFFSGLFAMLKFIFVRSCPGLAKFLGISLFPPATSKFFRKVVEETIKEREGKDIIRPDMIHLLMQARDKEDVGQKMTLEDIVSQAFIFFFAGFSTSSTLMCFVAHELAVNQGIQDRLREEVHRFTDENGKISYESMAKMPYMDMVVSETLRKFPPAILIDRLCTKRYELPPPQPGCKKVIVEPNQVLMFPVYGLHRDPQYFPNPDKFDPERFSDKNKHNILPYTYLPFGHGPRKCIGNRFALMETKILIAHLLQKFTLKTIGKTVEPIVYDKNEFKLEPVGGFWIGLEKRET